MHRIRRTTAPRRERGFNVLVVLVWLLASVASAALAHLLIGWCGAAGAGGDAYDDHSHASVTPMALAALAIAVWLVMRSAIRQRCRADAIDPVMLLARRFGTMRAFAPVALVAAGGLATLVAMEFVEQWSALGRVEGVADALGGNASCGLAIVLTVAALLTLIGLRSAHGLLVTAAATVGVLTGWFVRKKTVPITPSAFGRRTMRRPRRLTALTLLARCGGLRAPPDAFG